MKYKLLILSTPMVALILGWMVYQNQDQTYTETPFSPIPSQRSLPPEVKPPQIRFTDITHEAGIDFVHESGAYGEYLFPEILGPGCAFLDFDNDGDQDIFIVNSGKWSHRVADGSAPTVVHSLYRNDGRGNFVDVGKELGFQSRKYGQGVACGDINNDGFIDIYVTCVGHNALFLNQQGKQFIDIAEEAGVDCPEWSVPALFLDYDRDGRLDLFVGNFVKWDLEIHHKVEASKKKKVRIINGKKYTLQQMHTYGLPKLYEGNYCTLYRNLDGRHFKDVSSESNIRRMERGERPNAKSLGVGVCDYNDDGYPDIAVANDGLPDYLFLNQGDGTFRDVAQDVGVATSEIGQSRAGMGIAFADFRNDGSVAMAVSHFAGQLVGFYMSRDKNRSVFMDVANAFGLGAASMPGVMWGMFFFDYDLDGRIDFFLNNGHTQLSEAKLMNLPYKQKPVLYWNTGTVPTFYAVSPKESGKDFFQPRVGRGAAYGDIDNDGDLDVLTVSNMGSAKLFRNESGPDRKRIRLELIGTQSNRSALGAKVLLRVRDVWQRREVVSGGSYASQMELPVTFGLGDSEQVDELKIYWPSPIDKKNTEKKKEYRPQIFKNVYAGSYQIIEGRDSLERGVFQK